MNAKLIAAALLVVPVTACGGAAAVQQRSTAATPVAAKPAADVVPVSVFHDRAVFATRAVLQEQARARAEQHEQQVERRERMYARVHLLQKESRSCPVSPAVHFDTPDQAMTYLADAWNRHDLAEMCAVTTPAARYNLLAMRYEAQNLRFDHCDADGTGAYLCRFVHDYPARLHRHGHGEMQLVVAPATRQGWYTSGGVACG